MFGDTEAHFSKSAQATCSVKDFIITAAVQSPPVQQFTLLSGYFLTASAPIHPRISCHMVCLVLRQPLHRMRRPWHLPFLCAPREFQREGILSARDFLPGLSCSFPLQQKQQAAAKCSVNGSIHTVGERGGGGASEERERKRARGRGQLGFK